MRVTRVNARKQKRRERQAGAGITRSQIRSRGNSFIQSVGKTPEKRTSFGVLEEIFKGPYELVFEVMAPRTSTGFVSRDDGTLTILVFSGVAHVQKRTENESGEHSISYERVQTDEFATFEPGEEYSLGAGEGAVTFLRVQTKGYMQEIKQITESVSSQETVHVDRRKHGEKRPLDHYDENSPFAQPKSQRKSRDPSYRKHLASLKERDARMATIKKEQARKIRKPKMREQVVPVSGKKFRNPGATDQVPAEVPAINPEMVNPAVERALLADIDRIQE